ncbi:lysophospholipid acyltransferase family protein [Sphingomonas parapaucimobilis]|uniref:Putative acyltransferase n=1 Tax=Sphingomonas parapaucimobilis NBRC 15100 TaxID=1219049 RepID=A0A0A1W9H7_9SPHN|nr:lysophospholipid acyltransferase family protein [Sphingomonas parapaucimobilis]GAM01998.1 putative acyltransferase [Sphingomonas parapaucimobilis NBRC 15100]
MAVAVPIDADSKGGLRAAGRLLCIVGVLLIALTLHGTWRLVGRASPWPPRFLRRVAMILGADIRVTGTPERRNVMIAANHLSWMDILLLAGTSGTRFVAKAEVAALPLVGWLAGLNRTLFVERGDRLGVGDQVAAIRSALTEGQPLAVFPEGTTGDDLSVLPFKPALFAALVPPLPGIRVQPVRIDYGTVARDIAWLGTDPGDAHAKRVLRRRGRFTVTLHYLEPFDPAGFPDRKAIAADARRRIVGA